jgi:hypothetical protein
MCLETARVAGGLSAATASTVASSVGFAGTALSAAGAIASGRAQAQAAEFNAQAAVNQAAANEAQQRRNAARVLSQGRANVAASGIEMDGSPLEVMADSAAAAELDALTIRYGGQVRASQERMTGGMARSAGYTGAASTLLMGLNNASRSKSSAAAQAAQPAQPPASVNN